MVKVEKVDINLINPNEYNPNVMNKEKYETLVRNIKKEGEMLQPILINTENTIIDGEHRWRASKEAGLKKNMGCYSRNRRRRSQTKNSIIQQPKRPV